MVLGREEGRVSEKHRNDGDRQSGGWCWWRRKMPWLRKAHGGFWVLLVGPSAGFGLFYFLPFWPL